MNILKPFATLNLIAVLANRRTHVLLEAGAQSFVIAAPEELERVAGILDSLRKTWRVRLGVEGEIAPGTRVRLTGGPHEGRDGVAVCLPVFGGRVYDQYWVRLAEEGGLGEPVSAPRTWLTTLPPLPETRTKGNPRDLRSLSFDARYGRTQPVFERLDEAVLRALDTAMPEDIIVLGAEEYREHVTELLASRGRTDLHLAVAPHSYLAKALVTDGLSLGRAGVFLGYADARGTAVINVENSCTQSLPAGSYYLLNDYPLANCPEDELLEHLTGSPPYEYKFSSCGHCHAQGFHLNVDHWTCPLCGFSNPGDLYGRIAAGERIDFGPTPQQLEAAYEAIERRDVHVPGMKVIRITELLDSRESARGRHFSAGMFAVGAEELPDECPASVSQTMTIRAEVPGVSGTGLLIKPSHTPEGAFDGLLVTLGPKNVASLKAGEGILKTPDSGRPEYIEERLEPGPFRYPDAGLLLDERYGPFKARRVPATNDTPEKTPRRAPRPSPLPPPDETRVTTISYLVEEDGRRLDSSARLIGLGGAARLEAGMYVIVPSDWPTECAVKVLHSACVAVAADRVFPVWPQDTARAASEEYDRRRASARDARPAVTAFGTRRILDICGSVEFRPALRAAVAEARDGDAVVVFDEHERDEARRALRAVGKQTVAVALGPASKAGSPILVTGGHLLGATGVLVGGTGVSGLYFIFVPAGGLVTLQAHDFCATTTELAALVASAKVTAASRAQGGGTSAFLVHQPRDAGAARLQLEFAADCARPEGLNWRVVVLYGPEEAGELASLAELAWAIRPGVRVGTLEDGTADEFTGRRDHFTLATAEGFGSVLGRIAAGVEGYHRGMFDAVVVAEGYAPGPSEYLHFLKGRLDAKLLAAWTSAPPPEDAGPHGALTAGAITILPAESGAWRDGDELPALTNLRAPDMHIEEGGLCDGDSDRRRTPDIAVRPNYYYNLVPAAVRAAAEARGYVYRSDTSKAGDPNTRATWMRHAREFRTHGANLVVYFVAVVKYEGASTPSVIRYEVVEQVYSGDDIIARHSSVIDPLEVDARLAEAEGRVTREAASRGV